MGWRFNWGMSLPPFLTHFSSHSVNPRLQTSRQITVPRLSRIFCGREELTRQRHPQNCLTEDFRMRREDGIVFNKRQLHKGHLPYLCDVFHPTNICPDIPENALCNVMNHLQTERHGGSFSPIPHKPRFPELLLQPLFPTWPHCRKGKYKANVWLTGHRKKTCVKMS